MWYGTVELSITGGEVRLLVSTVIPEMPVPDEPIVSDEVIRESLIGQVLSYYDKIGPKEHEIKGDEPITFKELVVFPIIVEDVLEIRLCRELELWLEAGQGPRWYIFCDVITGELIDALYPLIH